MSLGLTCCHLYTSKEFVGQQVLIYPQSELDGMSGLQLEKQAPVNSTYAEAH